MSSTVNQKELVQNTNWDCLIILDACRYDYFEEIYGEYLEGNLRKALSPGSHTDEWLIRIFDESYSDVVYISSTPRVNSNGLEITEGFVATNYFHKIFDVWDRGWDAESRTISPESVAKATRLARAKYPDKSLISHFMQPHFPYISIETIANDTSDSVASSVGVRKDLFEKIRGLAGKIAISILGRIGAGKLRSFLKINKLRDFLGIGPPISVEAFSRRYGDDVLQDSYEKNLRYALSEVQVLVERLPGKVVVTSDHGEFLGENGRYSHTDGSDDPILREVPWLEVSV